MGKVNDKTGRSSKLRLLLLFLMPGIIILTVVFEIQTNIEKNSQSGNRRNGIGRIGTGPAAGMTSDRRKINRTEELSARRETGSGKNFLTFGPESPRPSRWNERTE